MPDIQPQASADTVRREVLRLAEEALPPGLPPMAAALLPALTEGLAAGDLAAIPPGSLAGAAASLFQLMERRLPGQARIRVLPAGRFHTPVVEVVTDDMPFLVDSVLGALTRPGGAGGGRVVRQVLHPILGVTRDQDGTLAAIGDGPLRESVMRIALAGGEPNPAATEAMIAATLSDVRRTVEDFPAMLAELRLAEAQAEGEAAEFLRWLADENFVLLGHRRLVSQGQGFRAEANLGLLADTARPVFDVLADLNAVPPGIAAILHAPQPVVVLKANMRSTVHRPQHADVIATPLPGGGVRLFLGLFAAAAYNRNPRSIPLLSSKVARIVAAAGATAGSHDERALRNILDTWPRDELFQASEAEILSAARRALSLTLTPGPALVLRPDPFGRYVSAIVWLPRENFDTTLRSRVGEMLARAHGGRLSVFYIALGDSPLARVHYIIGTDPAQPVHPDPAALEKVIAEMARGFHEKVADALVATHGEAQATPLLARWGRAFPPAYDDTETALTAASDIDMAEAALAANRPVARVLALPGSARRLELRLANPGGPLALADVLPLFESMGLRALEEVPHHLRPEGAPMVALHGFTLEAATEVEERRFPALLDTLSALLAQQAEVDGFNRLVLLAGLSWREAWLLRAMYRWLKQVGFPFAQDSVEKVFSETPQAATLLVQLFHARLNPDALGEETRLAAAWTTLLDGVADPDADRILSRMRTVLDAMRRTNFFQDKPYLSFKIESAAAGDMPSPRPWREIFVHSPRMEGCHLRAGPVARGGIRWSDRREDFRTEILGLMKAQRLKNVVIVPTGAKGGFILKHPPPSSDREAFMAEGIACYRTLVRGMLDITDNLDGMTVLPPPRVVRLDGDDPYIVAAADKGTASFSDIANGLSAEYGFWLSDAFASGGSVGYDHKAMGITARGAWVMIARHFEELGHDIFAEPFTVAGVGDMSGDVFGNGLLISRKTRLVAAFDHRHIFIDPNPELEASFAERERLFALPRSSWADYDTKLISPGGGVFPRTAKHITLSPEAQSLLGLPEKVEPVTVMRAILKLNVDLLYFGGIGTYIKAAAETQADAGDRANDAIRIDGRDLRARVVGEGANLGVTQAGRIETARQGIRINTDALDNSAGVSTSDHEVNIKILLADAEASGALTRRQRDDLLKEMTDEVAQLVLRDNGLQSLAVSLEVAQGASALPAQAALMARLEEDGLLDRALAGLPDDAAIARRAAAGEGLTRPEVAALLPFAKLWLNEAILESELPDDPALLPLLVAYFPKPLQERFAEQIARHRLRRDLIATALSNGVANRIGCAGIGRLTAEASPATVVRAAWLADTLLGLEAAYDAADAVHGPAKLDPLAQLRALHAQATRHMLAEGGPLSDVLAALKPGLPALGSQPLGAAPAILRLAREAGAAPEAAATAWDKVAGQYHLAALRAAAEAAPVSGQFGNRARAALLADIDAAQARLAAGELSGGALPAQAEAVAKLVEQAGRVPDLSAVTVAARALATLG
ncbi:phage capsid protein [Rhodovarius crocodyli]|uniref:Phage capsid protein n=1 Tax=Rhodovarius crocodyli TaxID=1979269 RepID=A0A437MPN8_9PROT|nr:NAD-glutamate dehydrogenase domain-containing protein [Rhodovarius crocodyli]RVT99609.1 phage capsid protein [Rhodovarius crocodyli]